MKFLFWLAVLLAVIWFLRRNKKGSHTGAAGPTAPDAGPTGDPHTEAMLQCRQCGIYLPASDALRTADGDVFCCDEHRSSYGS